MVRLVRDLRERFDYLIFDTPPILGVTDAAVLSGMLDGTVLVVKASSTSRDAAKRSLKQLNDVRARSLGVVLNQVDFRKEGYYYKSYYYYTDEGEKETRWTRGNREIERPQDDRRNESYDPDQEGPLAVLVSSDREVKNPHKDSQKRSATPGRPRVSNPASPPSTELDLLLPPEFLLPETTDE
jgi:hypothetical protein